MLWKACLHLIFLFSNFCIRKEPKELVSLECFVNFVFAMKKLKYLFVVYLSYATIQKR